MSTASRALSGARPVQDELVARIQEEAAALGYRPNQAARGLRTARSMTLGVVFFQLENPVSLDVIDGLGAGAQAADYSLFVTSARRDPELYRTLIQRFFERRVDGLILVRPQVDEEVLAPFVRAGIPVLALLGRGKGAEALPVVTVDTSTESIAMLREAASRGHRAVTVIAEGVLARPGGVNQEDRLPQVPDLILRRRSMGGSLDRLREVVAADLEADPPTTAFVVPYPFTGQLSDVLDELGRRRPQDVSFVSFTDSRMFAASSRIAAIHVDTVELGRRSAELITRWIDGEVPPAHTSLTDISAWVPGATFGRAPGVGC